MKRNIFVSLFLAVLLFSSMLFSGCDALGNASGKPPANFTEGISYSKDYEDDVLEIYDDAIVFDEFDAFGEVTLLCGSEDDFDDIVDFYKSFFEDQGITLSEERQERDEYYASGVFDGFKFRLKIAEPDGDFVEDLYENVITLSTVETEDEPSPAQTAPTASPSATSEQPGASPSATQDIARPDCDQYETRINSLEGGTWYCDPSYNPNLMGVTDWTIYIDDASSGTMYYTDYTYGGSRWWDYFTYSVQDGIIKFDFSSSLKMEFFAYYDYGTLHFVDADDFNREFYFANYGTARSDGAFDAFGDWLYYEPEDGFVGTISFWPNGTGYVYNWNDEGVDTPLTWVQDSGQVTFYDDDGLEMDTFDCIKKHNVIEVSSIYDSSPYFYTRTEHSLLPGYYEMTYTSEDGLTQWDLGLYSDYSAYVRVLGSNVDYENDAAYWYVDHDNGKLYIYMFDKYFAFDYHHFESGLLLYEEEDGNYYEFALYE